MMTLVIDRQNAIVWNTTGNDNDWILKRQETRFNHTYNKPLIHCFCTTLKTRALSVRPPPHRLTRWAMPERIFHDSHTGMFIKQCSIGFLSAVVEKFINEIALIFLSPSLLQHLTKRTYTWNIMRKLFTSNIVSEITVPKFLFINLKLQLKSPTLGLVTCGYQCTGV